MPAQHCIFLAGAPDGEALCWDEPALLSASGSAHPVRTTLDSSACATPLPKWRSIAFERANVPVSWPSQDRTQRGPRHATDSDSDFLEHSIALLELIDSSHIITSASANVIGASDANEATFVSFNTTASLTDSSFGNVSDATSSTQEHSEQLPNANVPTDITDLKRIPKADHIQRMQPQTITVNLLVGIIAVSPARGVQLRRRKLDREIIEIIVGDETRAGFGITFWLVPEQDREMPPDNLRQTLRALRPGHVVLLKSVALSSFRGSVYGQSLNKRFAKNSTLLHVLGDATTGDPSHRSSKLGRVRQWTSDFVGNVLQSSRHTPNARGEMHDANVLPPDTQD